MVKTILSVTDKLKASNDEEVSDMDTVKIGKFLNELRKEKGFTQEQLGEKVGVTNKTVSRWENGNYMPPVECLTLLSDIYGVSINEILSGQRLEAEKYADAAEDNLKSALELSEAQYKKSEKTLFIMLTLSTIVAMVTIILLPIDKSNMTRGILLIFLVVVLAFFGNTANIVALALNREKYGKRD